ncbi:hypothetical protein BJ085DRAFT_29817 [Dimargaris cristalligena]|uniref:F-box domain-containing protein n=1 Tax=Dimargaris cristalligena TaxID=215637 RepID=A0A4P9ZUS4_9FUNG|nr:hypothetical protein BJ085DRAFT_29817 [Dimargaris cristalligena]|eukprot:RKP37305.1 hypothetical protein BJ085DRAFT_29817 [Dimargaris cristalligena]
MPAQTILPDQSHDSPKAPPTAPGRASVGHDLLCWILHPAHPFIGRQFITYLSTRDQIRLAAASHSLRSFVEPVYQVDMPLHAAMDSRRYPGLARILRQHGGGIIRRLDINEREASTRTAARRPAKVLGSRRGHRIIQQCSQLEWLSISLTNLDRWPQMTHRLAHLMPKHRAPQQLTLHFEAAWFRPRQTVRSIMEPYFNHPVVKHWLARIRRLDIDAGHSGLNSAEIMDLLAPFTGLEALNLAAYTEDYLHGRELVHRFPQIKQLRLHELAWDTGLLFHPRRPAFHHLVNLDVFAALDETTLATLRSLNAKDYPCLRGLGVACHSMTFDEGEALMSLFEQPWPKLKSLRLNGCFLRDELGPLIARNLPQLQFATLEEFSDFWNTDFYSESVGYFSAGNCLLRKDVVCDVGIAAD